MAWIGALCILTGCSEQPTVSDIEGTWEPTEKYYREQAERENEGRLIGSLTDPLKFSFKIEMVDGQHLVTRTVEGFNEELQDYKIMSDDGRFRAVPISSGTLPDLELEIWSDTKINFIYPNGNSLPMARTK